MINIFSLLKDLITIPSPSENEEEICEFVFDFLENEGLAPEKIPVDKNGFNILVHIGQPKLYLAAHLDTVPTPLAFKETPDEIIGRGACDTKGSLAAMVVAALEAKKQGINNFGLLLTVGEETHFRGAKKIVEIIKNLPFVIVGEPTNLEVVNSHFGILGLKLISRGKSAHSSQPWLGENAIDKLLTAISRVKKVTLESASTVNLGKINGGTASNIIPDLAEAKFSFRIAPGDTKNYIAEFQKAVGNLVQIETSENLKSVYTPIPKELDFIKAKETVRYCTELSFFEKGVVLGPGDIQFAHSDHEKITKNELVEAKKIYLKILRNFA